MLIKLNNLIHQCTYDTPHLKFPYILEQKKLDHNTENSTFKSNLYVKQCLYFPSHSTSMVHNRYKILTINNSITRTLSFTMHVSKKCTKTHHKQWITWESVVFFWYHPLNILFFLLCHCPLSLPGKELEELKKAELRQIKGSVCWDKRWYHVETNYRGAVSKCVEAITAIQQPYQQGCYVPLAYARCM